jgi:hypothetical protein
MATRDLISQIYRPVGPKTVSRGIAWSSGGSFSLAQGIDLSLPIRGLRLVMEGRLVTAGADYASANPEGLLNLISRIRITGTNRRQGGNVTLYDMDLASLWVMQHLTQLSAAYFTINNTHVPTPTTPFPAVGANGYFSVTAGTFDYRIVVDIPFHPFAAPPSMRPGFLVRQEEYKDSLQLQLTYGTVTNGAVASALGTGAAATTNVFTGYGVATGNPTIDLYSLPLEMGLDLKDALVPGLLARVQTPVNTILQTAGTGVVIAELQKQKTTRLIAKIGVSTANPAFSSLSDLNATALGIVLGGNRNVRERVSVFAHKLSQQEFYARTPIQGYNLLDFIESGNFDSAYPGDRIGDGATFQLVGDVAGVGNAYGLVFQEQMIFVPEGPMFNPS